MAGFSFLPQISGQQWGPTNAICCSVNVDRVVASLGGGGDTLTLHVVIELFALRNGGDPKT